MLFWNILVYVSIAVCYFGGIAVAYGWIKHGIDQNNLKSEASKRGHS